MKNLFSAVNDMQTMNFNMNQLITDTYKSLCPIIINYIYHRIGDYESARDLAQDVFLRLMDYKQMLRKDTMRSMVFTIARNLLYDYLRRHYKKQELMAYYYDYAVTITDETESSIIADDISLCEKSMCLRLSPQRRTVYLMSRYQDKSVSDISDELCLSRRTVENHLQAGRKEIREYIQQCI
jgi:RNA polymerase sigma factor (sigma-70 family)